MEAPLLANVGIPQGCCGPSGGHASALMPKYRNSEAPNMVSPHRQREKRDCIAASRAVEERLQQMLLTCCECPAKSQAMLPSTAPM